MKRLCRLFLFLHIAVVAQGQQPPQVSKSALIVRLPSKVDPSTAQIHAGIYGRGLSLTRALTKTGVYDYPINVTDSFVGAARSVKLLIYVPGYRMVAAEFQDTEFKAGMLFEPPLRDLRTAEVKGRLVDSGEQSVVDHTLSVIYSVSAAMGYFGYIDGSAPIIPVGIAKTDSKGEFTINVPSFLDDPFLQSNGAGQFQLISETGTGLLDQTLKPSTFPVQMSYDLIVVRKIPRGILSGKLGKGFFERNSLSSNLEVYVRRPDTIPSGIELNADTLDGGTSFNANLKVDGSFEVQIPEGVYDLRLWVPAVQKHILVQSGVTVEGNKRKIIEVP